MILGCKVGSKIFTDPDPKKAYLKGAKYFAKFSHWNEAYLKIIEIKNSDIPTFEFQLYTCRDVNKDKNHECQLCRDFHCSFFVNENYNCDSCRLNSFFVKEQKTLNISKNAYKKKIKR